MVAKMDKLFDIERSLKAEQADPERIKEVRNEKARPIMEEIHEYNNYLKVTYLQTGKLGEAVTYLNNQWEYLMNYRRRGCLIQQSCGTRGNETDRSRQKELPVCGYRERRNSQCILFFDSDLC